MNETAERTRAERALKKALFVLFFFAVFCGILVAVAYCGLGYIHKRALLPHDAEGAVRGEFAVASGESLSEIAHNLKEAGYITGPYVFIAHAVLTGNEANLKAGTYILDSSVSIAQIVALMAHGMVVSDDLRITFLEGLRLLQTADILHDHGIAIDMSVYTAEQFSLRFDFLNDTPPHASLEGYLFPDTYRFKPNKDDYEYFLSKMLENFGQKMNGEMREEIVRRGKTIFDVVTMASLIEKEVRSNNDKKIVSGILWKRIAIGMPLQVDAAINYIVKKNTTQLTYADLEVDSPYNTYRNKGLPPGPISNPGLSSLLAAIYPTESEYLFYLSKPDGETVFSKTFEEHVRNKNLYLR